MRLRIRHQIRFEYSRPVFLEPTTIRICPRTDASQHLHAFDLAVEPTPHGLNENLDLHGNRVVLAWFGDRHDRLSLSARAEVETLRRNPFDFLVTDPAALELPFDYPACDRSAVEPFLKITEDCPEVVTLANERRRAAGGATTDFLIQLAAQIQQNLPMVVRLEGPALPPSETLRRGEGACRDLALLYIDACRSQGLAARFVSGYQFDPESEETSPQLHAWAEVYLPGAGWRAYDPGLGLAVADRHVALATADQPDGAAVTEGTFRGTGASSRMSFELEIVSVPAE